MFSKLVIIAATVGLVVGQEVTQRCKLLGLVDDSGCAAFINDFCNDVSRTPVPVGDRTSRCFNLPNGNKCDFIAFNGYKRITPPNNVHCKAVLKSVIDNCRVGGEGAVGPNVFTFTVDPKLGPCRSTSS